MRCNYVVNSLILRVIELHLFVIKSICVMLSGGSLEKYAVYLLNPLVSTMYKWVKVCGSSVCGSVR
jgi:hypothetical protein